MQTFLPYPDFDQSAAVLDGPRLGKQRVETLQILRALVLPDYGWQPHPVVGMWRSHVPALVRYGLAMADEWIARGHADSTRRQILEFAPDPRGPMPEWLGNEQLHLSHRSNLITKDPGFYTPRFPGTPAGLPYFWPEPVSNVRPEEPQGQRLWVARAAAGSAVVLLPALGVDGGPLRGKPSRQLGALLEQADEGDPVAVPLDGGARFAVGKLGRVTGTADLVGRELLLGAEVERGVFPRPELLQDPRQFFAVPLTAQLAAALADAAGH